MFPHALLSLASLALGSLLTPAGLAGERPERNVLRPALPLQLEPGHSTTQVILKFADATPIRWSDGRLVPLGSRPADFDDVEELLDGTTVSRLFTRPVADLDQERAALLERVPAHRPWPVDLNQYYRVVTSGAAQTVELVEALLALPSVETAYPERTQQAFVPLSGDIAPTTPQYESGQGHLGSAPLGLGHEAVRTMVGGRAPDLNVAHLESSWHFGHEDACQMVTGSVIGDLPGAFLDSWKDHGAAVAGVLCADRNGYGMRGMADGANLMLASFQFGSADMISTVTALAEAGDVFVSSGAWLVQGQYHAPLDYEQAEFDAILTASTKGIVYCYGSGNTNTSLDDISIYGNRYTPGAADSGGVIVGAGESTSLDKSGFSNYGTRVDCHAWGDGIWTLGYGSLFSAGDPLQTYADDFNGTSGSGPQVAGVAAVISNIVREQNGEQLGALEIRELMRTLGTPQGAGGHVGPRPDLVQILASVGLPDGLVIPADAEIGQPVTADLTGTPSAPMWLLMAADRGRLDVGLNRDLLLDPAQLIIVPGFQFDANGTLSLTDTVPNQPSLQGLSLFVQAAEFGPVKRLTNSSEIWIRD
jgi:hypothetical protein